MDVAGHRSKAILTGFNGKSEAQSRAQHPRLSYRTAASSSEAAPSSTRGTFSAGAGRAGTASTAKPQVSTEKRALASSETIKESQGMAKLFLQTELGNLFQTGKLTKEKYGSDFRFQDPVAKVEGIDSFQSSLAALRTLFKVDLVIHSTAITGDTQITTRWTMELTPRLTPWVQKLVFTGRSFYTIDVLSGGKITAQRDVWDAIQDNNHLSLEGLAYLIRQLTSGQTSPNLESPKYVVLKKTKEYEIRRYSPYLAAEVSMPSNAKPASGEGFQELAGYIFGGNQGQSSMEMTTPVYSTAGQADAGKMSFPIEEKEGNEPQDLPVPNDARVSRTKQEAATVAAGIFGGLPLDFEVTEAVRSLRGALLLDGIKAEDGYKLARYNDPFTLPFLRRNEILVRLDNYQLESAES